MEQPETPSLSPCRPEVHAFEPASPSREDMLPVLDPHNPPEQLLWAPRKRRAAPFGSFATEEAHKTRRTLNYQL